MNIKILKIVSSSLDIFICSFILFLAGGQWGCSPKIYLVDRQTVLEEEAAGEWPDFEKELIEKLKAQGPTPFVKVENSDEKSRLYQILNGEMTQKEKDSKDGS